MKSFNSLMKTARRLEQLVDTDYAETHPEKWDRFEKDINNAHDAGTITAEQFNKLACIAFYDFFDLKEVF